MVKDNDTRDVAMKALVKIDSHIDACERRYQEGNQRMEKMFSYIKDAHEKTGNQIDAIRDTLAEQRGAGKLGKIMAHAATGLVSAASALGIGVAIHK